MAAKPTIMFFIGIVLVFATAPKAAPVTNTPPPFEVIGQAGPDKCIACHAWRQPDPQPRPLKKPHDALVFAHWPQPGAWCDRCHNPQEPRKLTLHHDQSVQFDEAHRQCAQCHGAKVRDWLFGVHGKRSGNWQGSRRILPCSACHNPHQPAWKPVVPSTPPARPGSHQPWQPQVQPPTTVENPP